MKWNRWITVGTFTALTVGALRPLGALPSC